MGDYQDKAWEYNVNLPHQRGMNEYWGQKQAGMDNLWSGLDTMGSAAVSGYSGWQQRKGMDSLIEAVKGVGSSGSTFSSSYVPEQPYTGAIKDYQFGGIFKE
jgi:hypothetical protein